MGDDLPDGVDTVIVNRSAWDRWSDTYQAKHGWLMRGEHAAAWGLWRVPESELNLLGEVEGRDVVELGCGAAHWSLALAEAGARVIAIDNSAAQLRHAADTVGGRVTLVQAAVEALPLGSEGLDLAFSDYGGMSWADPARSVPEVGRVLRPGGRLVFCTASPFFFLFLDVQRRELTTELQRPYFTMRRREVDGVAIDFHVSFGEWISCFSAAGLVVEKLIEVVPPEQAFTTFRDRPLEWARQWPVEMIWSVRKEQAC